MNRSLYKRFRTSHSPHSLYSGVMETDLRPGFRTKLLPAEATSHIDSVLEAYAGMTGTQLEELTHREEPWIRARGGLAPNERCEEEIDENLMTTFYRTRLT